ncbi:MAG: pentapeptide repeat-containing protein, partial [Methanosarcina sp.]|nr:pentapeptide repeat-containing protein [Methanosarcina sp.]
MKKKILIFISVFIISMVHVHLLFAASEVQLTRLTLSDVTEALNKSSIFRNVDLSKLDLTGSDLSKISLHNSSLNGTILKKVRLADALLMATDLSDSNLQEAEMTGFKSDNSNFIKADLR